jgi:hypothetical protein
MSELQRRYASLMRLYPAAYRQARGAEMLTVLMDSAPQDRRRPQWREVQALILGALRVRAGAQGHRTAGQSWQVSLRAAALLLLIQTAGDTLWQTAFDSGGGGPLPTQVAMSLIIATTVVGAIIAVCRGAFLVATVMAAGAFVVQMISPGIVQHFSPLPFTYFVSPAWQLLFVLVLLIPLIGRGPVMAPKALNLLLLVPGVSVALDGYGTLMHDAFFQTAGRTVWQTLAIATLLWSVVDERVAMTFGLAFLNVVVNRAMIDAPSELSSWPTWLALLGDWSTWRWRLIDMGALAILPILNIAVGAAVAVRRARI